jgi:hypothetical protein
MVFACALVVIGSQIKEKRRKNVWDDQNANNNRENRPKRTENEKSNSKMEEFRSSETHSKMSHRHHFLST